MKGVAPVLPPAKGEGDGESFDSSPGSFRGRGINKLSGVERGFPRLPPVAPVVFGVFSYYVVSVSLAPYYVESVSNKWTHFIQVLNHIM